MDNFTKQIYEEFVISADFANNMASGEVISTETCVVLNNAGEDKSATVTDQTTLDNDGAHKAFILVRAGLVAEQPYKITFQVVTDAANKWELDIKMKIVEQ